MSIDVREQVVIRCPRARVAAFMFDPRNEPTWMKGVVQVKPAEEGRLHGGSRVQRTAKFMGREVVYEYEVIGAEGDQFVEMRVEKPFPMRFRYELEEMPGATRVTMQGTGDGGGIFRFAGPILGRMVRGNVSNALAELRQHLESTREP